MDKSSRAWYLFLLVASAILVVVLSLFMYLVTDLVNVLSAKYEIDMMHVEGCFGNQGVLLDNVCYDPDKLEDAKLHITIN